MTRKPELHELFADWLSGRESDAAEDPPRDLALHAAGCERCLRSASAIDTLSVIDVGAADAPPLRVAAIDERGRLLRVARYAVAATALVLVAGSVAIGSSWLGSVRPTDSTGLGPTPSEGVLAGVPSATTRSPTPTPSASPSGRPSPSARASESPTDEPAAPTFVIPVPTDQPPPPPPPTAAPTVAPSAAPPPPTTTPIPTSPPTATPTLPPPPTPTPTLDADGDGVPDDVDQCPFEPAGPTPDPTRPGCPLPTLP